MKWVASILLVRSSKWCASHFGFDHTHDVSVMMAAVRNVIFGIAGGIIGLVPHPGQKGLRQPGAFHFFLFVEGRFKDFLLRNGIIFKHLSEIAILAAKQDFGLSGFYAFESDRIKQRITIERRYAIQSYRRCW